MRQKDSLISGYVLPGYLFLMLCIYPFYFNDGYYDMASSKYVFFRVVSVITVIVILVSDEPIIDIKRIFAKQNSVSVTEKLLLIYMIAIVVSFICSPYKKDVLWGAEGWYMGTMPLLLMCGMALFLTHLWKERKWLCYGGIIASGIVFVLGICNRFSFYPIEMKPHHPSFISTLGNINWFCGYMSVLAPIGIGLFILKEKSKYKHSREKWLLAVYIFISFTAGFCQGSSSVFLWNGAMFVMLLWIALSNISRMKNWLFTLFLWGTSGQFVRLLKNLLPEYYNYENALLIDSNITLFIALAALFLFVICCMFFKENKETDIKIRKILRSGLLIVVFCGVLLLVAVSAYNTMVGIPALSENKIFLWDENWGNGRGASLKAAFILFGEMSVVQKLFGVGADGFSLFAGSVPQAQTYIVEFFGERVLTNAHCEIVTNLINLGIIGVIVFIGIIFTFIFRCMKNGEELPVLYIFAVCTVCYMANNLISFAQLLNTPFLFLILGVGEYYLNKQK